MWQPERPGQRKAYSYHLKNAGESTWARTRYEGCRPAIDPHPHLWRLRSESRYPFQRLGAATTGTTHINPQILIELVSVRMPFGKYRGRILCDLPEPYLVWFRQKGFPLGQIGIQLSALYEIKLNGLEYLLKPIRKKQP